MLLKTSSDELMSDRELSQIYSSEPTDRRNMAMMYPKNLWPICGQNSQYIAVKRWQRMGKNHKTLDFLGGCNFRKGKNLRFCGAYGS